MNNPTRYTCPKCGHALQFWYAITDDETPCWCYCPDCLKQSDEPGKGTDAASAFKDWQSKNAVTPCES